MILYICHFFAVEPESTVLTKSPDVSLTASVPTSIQPKIGST